MARELICCEGSEVLRKESTLSTFYKVKGNMCKASGCSNCSSKGGF